MQSARGKAELQGRKAKVRSPFPPFSSPSRRAFSVSLFEMHCLTLFFLFLSSPTHINNFSSMSSPSISSIVSDPVPIPRHPRY